MSKRGSGKQITKDDDVDRLAEGGDEGSFEDQKASAEEMKTRKIFVPKRMLSAAGAQAAAPAAAAPAAETPAFPVFKFGSTETPAAAPAETNGKSSFPTFNFGTPSTNEETKSETVTSAASASQSTDSSSSSSSSSSSESTAAASTSSSSSSSDSATTSASSGAFSGFTFGSGGFNFGNATWGKLESFSSIAPSSSSAFSISSSSSTFQFDNTAPVLKDAPAVVLDEFKNKAPEASGEEDETTVCKVNARAFVLEKKTEKAEEGAEKKPEAASSSEEAAATKWAERGRGDVKINKRQDGSKTVFRLLMRAEKTHRVVINAPLLSSFKFTPENEKFIRFASVDQDLKPVAYLLKFASKDEFRTFSAGLTDAVSQLQGAEKTA